MYIVPMLVYFKHNFSLIVNHLVYTFSIPSYVSFHVIAHFLLRVYIMSK